MVLLWQLSTHIHIHGTVKKKKPLVIGITQNYIRSGTNWDVYKRPLYFLRRVWWCLSHYHWTLHFRCSVEAFISLNLAMSTAVMAMKLQLVTDTEIFCKKKVDTSFCHDKRMLYVYSRTCHSKRNWKNANNFVYMDTSMVPLAYSSPDSRGSATCYVPWDGGVRTSIPVRYRGS
jgi:hypothetical protein